MVSHFDTDVFTVCLSKSKPNRGPICSVRASAPMKTTARHVMFCGDCSSLHEYRNDRVGAVLCWWLIVFRIVSRMRSLIHIRLLFWSCLRKRKYICSPRTIDPPYICSSRNQNCQECRICVGCHRSPVFKCVPVSQMFSSGVRFLKA